MIIRSSALLIRYVALSIYRCFCGLTFDSFKRNSQEILLNYVDDKAVFVWWQYCTKEFKSFESRVEKVLRFQILASAKLNNIRSETPVFVVQAEAL